MPKLTEWFDGTKFVPGQPGVYQVKGEQTYYKYWDGLNWYLSAGNKNYAVRNYEYGVVSYCPDDNFRGLKEPHGTS